MADLNAVKVAIQRLEEELREAQREECECEANAADHKGPCGSCSFQAKIRTLLLRGNRVAGIQDPLVFDTEATEFLKDERRAWRY